MRRRDGVPRATAAASNGSSEYRADARVEELLAKVRCEFRRASRRLKRWLPSDRVDARGPRATRLGARGARRERGRWGCWPVGIRDGCVLVARIVCVSTRLHSRFVRASLRFSSALRCAFRPRYIRVFVRASFAFLSRFVASRSRFVASRSRFGGWVSNALVFSRRLGGFPPPEVGVRHGLPGRRGRACGWHPFFPAEAFACWYSVSFPATRMVRRVRAYVNSQSGGAIRKHLATASGQIGAVHFWPAPASARFSAYNLPAP